MQTHRFSISLWVVLFLFTVGLCLSCSSDSSSDGEGPPTSDGDVDTPSGSDGDSNPPPGDSDGGLIIPPVTDGDKEDEGPECRTDSDCAGTDYCDTEYGICRPRRATCEPCEAHIQCGYRDDYCLPNGVCGRYCDTSIPCSEGYICQSYPEFGGDGQCTFDESQTDGALNSPCCANEHCTAPNVCYNLTARCYQGCTGGAVCPPGQFCYDDSEDDRNAYCKPGCIINEDCPLGEICYEHQCYEGECSSKADCPMEHLCNVDNYVFSCYPGCDNDENCYAQNECISEQCEERIGCEGTWQCKMGFMCTEELPFGSDPADRGCCFNPRESVSTIGENTCDNPRDPQKFCDACTDTQNENNECGTDNVCVELKEEDENGNEVSKGHFCLVKWDCSARTEGELDEGSLKCPRGYTCIKIESDNLNGKFCLADCTDEGIINPGR